MGRRLNVGHKHLFPCADGLKGAHPPGPGRRKGDPAMLTFYGSGLKKAVAVAPGAAVPDEVNWIDAYDPTPDELDHLRRAMDTRIPTLAELSEIEASSRLSSEGSSLFMSMPASAKDADGFPRATPIGFVLNRSRLATVRYAHLASFETLAHQTCAKGELSGGGLGATVTILEMIADQLADVLERIGGDLDAMSHQVFTRGLGSSGSGRPQRTNAALAKLLRSVGANGDLLSKVSESLLGLSRMVPFLNSKGREWMTPDFGARLDTLGQDTRSLREFEEHLANKTQFMLDTVLGLANIEQNNVFRVLTVVSVVGIPPTFFASLYGMNFKTMPELDWSYGYAYGLIVITISGLLPAIWFKIKGWW